MTVHLERVHHSIGRAAEYFSVNELEKQTGQPRQGFAAMALKELVDNALDAAEIAVIAPEITITANMCDGEFRLSVSDNGPGLPADIIGRILDFSSRTSDKLAYRAPSRGQQGNALKTLIGLPTALGSATPLIIKSRGERHEIRAGVNPLGETEVDHARLEQPTPIGTTVSLAIPASDQVLDAVAWARSFALLNPHAHVSVKSRVRGGIGNLLTSMVQPNPTTLSFTNRSSLSRTAGASGCRAIRRHPTGTTRRRCKCCSMVCHRTYCCAISSGNLPA